MIISEMFHGRTSLNSVPLQLLVNFVSEAWLELMNISLIVNIRPSVNHVHVFQLLVVLPYLIEITFLICTSKLIFLNLKESSDRLVIVGKGFLKLPNVNMLMKQKRLSFPRNLALVAFSKLLIVFSTEVNLL